jgi:hypothetical protein
VPLEQRLERENLARRDTRIENRCELAPHRGFARARGVARRSEGKRFNRSGCEPLERSELADVGKRNKRNRRSLGCLRELCLRCRRVEENHGVCRRLDLSA